MIVKAKNLRKIYNLPYQKVEALRGIDFEIEEGEFVSIVGPSGAGKTTLLNLIGCLDTPSSGKLEVLGHELSGAEHEEKLRSIRLGNIGFVFEEFHLIPSLTAEENVMIPLLFMKIKPKRSPREILEDVGLSHRLEHLPSELSGGELQRVGIARALITQPKIILADEPTGNLDVLSAQNMFSLFRDINEREGTTIIVATHNLKLAHQARRILHLLDGRIIRDEKKYN